MALVVLVLVLLVILAWTQRGTIIRLLSGSSAPTEELEQQVAVSQQKLEQTVNELPMRELTAEEEAALADGSMSAEDVAQALVDETAEDSYQKDMAALMARIYALRASYNATLDGMLAQAQSEYAGFTDEQKSRANLLRWASGYVASASAMEKSCDEQMNGIMAEMTALIEANNGDMSLVDEVNNSYAAEKSLKKSQFIGQLQERGLI